ncbi:MAG: HyaD/HybD family hydrogenase maturation endopeptidase [Sedimentisphaerales bacterium]
MNGQSQKKDVVVIGLGNVLLSDEGIGVHLVRRLSSQQDKFPPVEFIDAGSGGISILHLIANRKKTVIIDCAKMGAKPGTIRRFTSDEVQSIKKLSNYSLHEVDILQVINLSKQLGECPHEVVFFGIEPEVVGSGMELSKTLAGKLEHYVSIVCRELES